MLSISFSIYITPSVPMANPARFADIIMMRLNPPPMAQTCLYHGFEACYTNTAQSTVQNSKQQRPTFDAGSKYAASSSGKINRLISQPQASNWKEMSCHSATKVKISTVVRAACFAPPRGMYMYLCR